VTRQTKLADSSGNLLKELQACWTRRYSLFLWKKKFFTRCNVPAFFAARVNLYKYPKRAEVRDEGISEVEIEGNNIGKSGAKLLKRLRLFLASGSRQMRLRTGEESISSLGIDRSHDSGVAF